MSINNSSLIMKTESKNASHSLFSKTFTRRTLKSTLPSESKNETPYLGFTSEKGVKKNYFTNNFVVSDFREKFLNTRRLAKNIKKENGFKFSSNIKLIANNSFASTFSKESEKTPNINNYNLSIFCKKLQKEKKENIKIIQNQISEIQEIQQDQAFIQHNTSEDICEKSQIKLNKIQNDFLKIIKEKSAIKKELKKKVIQAFKRETILKNVGIVNQYRVS
jgi:hypothetical protein